MAAGYWEYGTVEHPFRVTDRRRYGIDISEAAVGAAMQSSHDFQNGAYVDPNMATATKAATTIASVNSTPARKPSELLREFLSNPKIVELLSADNKFVNYAELDQFCKELDYVDDLCRFTKEEAIKKLADLRHLLTSKRKRPGRGEWITMSGADADVWVNTLRKCIAVLGLKK